MSDERLDEFDDLDDYLEDPSKLDEPNEGPPLGNDEASSTNNDKDADLQASDMMGNLNKHLDILMQHGDQSEDPDMAKNCETLLKVLSEASKEKSANETMMQSSSAGSSNSSKKEGGFKNIVSNTLDRLKENSTKVDETLKEEKKNQNSDDVLSQLLDQLVMSAENGEGDGEADGMDNAILKMLSQMSSKEVLYQPMKQMQTEFAQWLELNSTEPEHVEKIDVYRNQYALVNQTVEIYERDDYTNEKYHVEIADLLDQLEQLGDSPVAKGFNNSDAGNEMSELAKLLEVEGDENLGNLDKDLEDTCKQQ